MKKILIFSILGILTFLNGAEISGQGFLRTVGGDVKTCAGEKVYLNIYTNDKNNYVLMYNSYKLYSKMYTTELEFLAVTKRKGNAESELSAAKDAANTLSLIPKTDYFETMCDAQGNFKFKDIKNGKYSIGTTIEWYVAKKLQGGFIDKEIDVIDGENTILITE